MTSEPSFAALLERFFTQHLMQQRRASAHTIASYRDSFRLLLKFVQRRLRKAPCALALQDIDAPLSWPSSMSRSAIAASRLARETCA